MKKGAKSTAASRGRKHRKSPSAAEGLSHYDAKGNPRMVDVGGKPVTEREARAHAFVSLSKSVLQKIEKMTLPKGDPLTVARLAGISAAKRTDELIPLCHPLLLSHIAVDLEICKNGIRLTSSVRTRGRTGVEMEALTAVSVAALTIYDMCKALDRSAEIGEIHLLEKSGGKSGPFRRTGAS